MSTFATATRESRSAEADGGSRRPRAGERRGEPGSLALQVATRVPGEAAEREADAAAEAVAHGASFGEDFGDVRIRTDGAAARALGARAYTIGDEIVFGEGEYDPATRDGQRLLAHELAHVVQQREGLRSVQRQVYGPPAPTGAGNDFDWFLLRLSALEQAAIADGYGFDDRITAFRKIWYDSASTAKTYAGAVIGGGAFNILIPGAAGTKLPPSWSQKSLAVTVDDLRKTQVLPIAGQTVDVGHLFAGADAARHPTSVSLAGGVLKLRSNLEAATWVGDLGSVVTEYIKGSKQSFYDTARNRSKDLDSYYDGSKAMASIEDMAGDADAYSLVWDASKTIAENLRLYYAATTGGVKKRFTNFAAAIGLGTLKGSSFTGDTKTWRDAMTEQVFNSALAYAAGKGWKNDVVLVFKDPGPGLVAPTFWEMYWNNSEWTVDIFVDRMTKAVAKE